MIQLDTVVTVLDELGNEVKKTVKDPADAGHTVKVGDLVTDGTSVGLVTSVAGDRPSVAWLPDSHVAYVPLRPFNPAPPAPVDPAPPVDPLAPPVL